MTLEFKRLTEVDLMDIVSLNNHPDVLRQMPLGSANFDLAKAKEWVQQKDAQWQQHGYGPWAFLIDQQFAGWGGLQYEEGDADLAIQAPSHDHHRMTLRLNTFGRRLLEFIETLGRLLQRLVADLVIAKCRLLQQPLQHLGIHRLGHRLDRQQDKLAVG